MTLAIGARLRGNDAFFVSQSVPATMTAGETYAVTVRMLNQGTTTWTPGQSYRLGSQNPHDNTTWGGRVNLLPGDLVSPGATATFSFEVTAPSSPGSYNFQWRMVQDGVEWFGAWTPNIAVQVVPRNNNHLSKIKEYVYAGGRLVSSEEKSCVPTLSPSSANLPKGESTGTVNVSASSGCLWSAVSNANWIEVTSGSGTGNGVVNYSVSFNNSGAQRSGTLTVNNKSFTIIQSPDTGSCNYTLNKSSESFSENAGNGSFTFSTGEGCTWTATSSVNWITITSSTSGSGSETINYSVASNPGSPRSGTITVGGKTFTISQALNPASCTYSLNKSGEAISEQGGNGALALTTQAGCPWTASSNASWLHITSVTSGNGSTTIHYSIDANGGQQRIGVISVGGQSFNITQEPNPASCSFSLTPNNQSFTAEGGGESFNVYTNAGCRWSAANNAGWITIGGATNNIGNGAVTFTVQINSGSPRSSTITIQGQVFTINQPECVFNVSPTSDSYDGDTYTGSISVSCPAFCSSWSAVSNASWITITSGSSGTGNGTVTYKIPIITSKTDKTRTGTLTVAGKTVTIIQNGHHPCWDNGVFICRLKQSNSDIGIGMLQPPGSHPGLQIKQSQLSNTGQWLFGELSRSFLALIIGGICGVSLIFLKIDWLKFTLNRATRIYRKFCISKYLYLFTVLRCITIRLAILVTYGVQKIGRLLEPLFSTAVGLIQSIHRSFIARGGKLILQRILASIVIVSLAFQITPAEAASLHGAVKETFQEIRKYVRATMNRSVRGATLHRHDKGGASIPISKVAFASMQAQNVTSLQLSQTQLTMYVGENYTLSPVPLDDSGNIVSGVGMQWSSGNSSIASVNSFGQVQAMSEGATSVQVQTGSATKQVSVQVLSGTRPSSSTTSAHLNAATSEQSNSNITTDDGVLLDWDPLPEFNSLAAHFNNAVGNPRFSPRKIGGGGVPTSVQLGSNNYQFNVPVVSIGGRGVNTSVDMSFNSRVWNNDNGTMTFNYVGAYPGPGWSMGYGKIIRNYNDTATGNHSGIGLSNSPGDYLLIASDGTRTRLEALYEPRYMGQGSGRWYLSAYEVGESVRFNQFTGELFYPDGTKIIYSSVNDVLLPTVIINTNGSAITMSYRDYCEGASCQRIFRFRTALNAIRDTLGRYITFHYYGDIDYPADPANGHPAGELVAIKALDQNGVPQEIVRVDYQPITLQYNFGGATVNAPANGTQIQVVRRVYYPQTGRGYLFLDYSSYGMPRKISSRMNMTSSGGGIIDGSEIAYTTYNYTTIDPNDPYGRNQIGSLTDAPQFTRRQEWWVGKTDATGALTISPTEYNYSRTTDTSTETDTIRYVGMNVDEITVTGTDSTQSSFGKVISVEKRNVTTSATLSKQIYTYTTGSTVEISQVEIIDEAGEGTLVSFTYGGYGRVTDESEYGYKTASGYNLRRRTHYDYLSNNYVTANMLRLVSSISIYDANDNLVAKTDNTYDDYASMGGMQTYNVAAIQYLPNHDSTYDQNKTLRGNLTAVTTYSQISPAVSTTKHLKYDIFGNVVQSEINCCETRVFNFSSLTAFSFPDSVQSGNTGELNLLTKYTYNYFTGLALSVENADGWETINEYDQALRLKQVTTPTGAIAVTQFDQDANGNDQLSFLNQSRYDDQGMQKIITNRQWFDGGGESLRQAQVLGQHLPAMIWLLQSMIPGADFGNDRIHMQAMQMATHNRVFPHTGRQLPMMNYHELSK